MVSWSHDPYDFQSKFDDMEADEWQRKRDRRELELRIAKLESQLQSVKHILEANGLGGDHGQGK